MIIRSLLLPGKRGSALSKSYGMLFRWTGLTLRRCDRPGVTDSRFSFEGSRGLEIERLFDALFVERRNESNFPRSCRISIIGNSPFREKKCIFERNSLPEITTVRSASMDGEAESFEFVMEISGRRGRGGGGGNLGAFPRVQRARWPPARPVYDSGMTLDEPRRADRGEIFSHGRPQNIERSLSLPQPSLSPSLSILDSLFRADTKSRNDWSNR